MLIFIFIWKCIIYCVWYIIFNLCYALLHEFLIIWLILSRFCHLFWLWFMAQQWKVYSCATVATPLRGVTIRIWRERWFKNWTFSIIGWKELILPIVRKTKCVILCHKSSHIENVICIIFFFCIFFVKKQYYFELLLSVNINLMHYLENFR